MMSCPSQWSGSWLMFYNGSSRSGGGFTRPWTMATSSRTSLDRSSVHSRERMDVDDMIEPISCPSIPRSSITWTVVGIRKDLLVYLSIYIYIYIYFFFFFCGYGVWGSTLHWLLNGGCDSLHSHVVDFHWLGGLIFGENPFSFPALSKAEPFDFLAFPFLISPSSVRLVSLTPLLACFALNLLNFLPNF